MIAFTNHALDHLLGNVLEAKITNRIARLGTRLTDDRLARNTLDALERNEGGYTSHGYRIAYKHLKEVEQEFKEVMEIFEADTVPVKDVQAWLDLCHHSLLLSIDYPPEWVGVIRAENKGWKTQTRGGVERQDENQDSWYAFWKTGKDIKFLQDLIATPTALVQSRGSPSVARQNRFDVLQDRPIQTPTEKPKNVTQSPSPDRESNKFTAFFRDHDVPAPTTLPTGDRIIDVLLGTSDVWSMSLDERLRLGDYWEEQARLHFFEEREETFQELKLKYDYALESLENQRDEV